MKKYIFNLPVLLLLLFTFFSCNRDSLQDDVDSINSNMGKDVRVQKQHYDRSRNLQDYGLIDNSKNIQKVINSFKYTIEYSIENDELNEDNLAAVFIENIKANGGGVAEFENLPKMNLSKEYKAYAEVIRNTSMYETKQVYHAALLELEGRVLNSKINNNEKHVLVDSIVYMLEFDDMLGELDSQYNTTYSDDCDGWWSCWGQCAAGVIGGAITGGVAGCAGVGAVFGTVGAGIGVFFGGVNAVTGAAVGAVSGCVVGGLAGAMGGALTGAATFC